MFIRFHCIDWTNIPEIEHKGTSGTALWRALEFIGLRISIIDYSEGYLADHWCSSGHIVHCLEGEFTSELANDESIVLKAGMPFVVTDDASSHRSHTKQGAKLFIH